MADIPSTSSGSGSGLETRKGKQSASKKTVKRCPSCRTECPVAVKKCRTSGCDFTFTKKKKDWDKVARRGQTSSTHECEKLQYRADVLYLHHNYNIVVLMHRKHGSGHNIHRYGTPGIAYDFLGDNSSEQPPTKEGQLFLNLFAAFCDAKQRQLEKKVEEPHTARQGTEVPVVDNTSKQSISCEEPTCTSEQQPQVPELDNTSQQSNIVEEPNTCTSRQWPQGQALDETSKQSNRGEEPDTFTSRQRPQGPALDETSKQSNGGKEPDTFTSQQQPQGPAIHVDKAFKQSNRGEEPDAFTSRQRLQGPALDETFKQSNHGEEPGTFTSRQRPQGPALDETSKQSNSSHKGHNSVLGPQVPPGNASASAIRTVVFYRRDDINLAVGFHHPERRILHGKTLPAGFDVVQLTWVNGPETPAPLILGDNDENATLSAGQFFALPRKNLLKVVASN